MASEPRNPSIDVREQVSCPDPQSVGNREESVDSQRVMAVLDVDIEGAVQVSGNGETLLRQPRSMTLRTKSVPQFAPPPGNDVGSFGH